MLWVTIHMLKEIIMEGTHPRVNPSKFVISFVVAIYEWSSLILALLLIYNIESWVVR